MGSEIEKEVAVHKLCVQQPGGSASGLPALPVPDLMGEKCFALRQSAGRVLSILLNLF